MSRGKDLYELDEDTDVVKLDELGLEANTVDESLGDVAHIVVLAGSSTTKIHSICGDVSIGRGTKVQVQIDQRDVSRLHARIRRLSSGSYMLEDAGSRNGTFLNGVAVKSHPLSFGDRIKLGSRALLLFTRYAAQETQLMQSQRMESLGQLAAGIAHEINNPLTYVVFNMESLLRDLPRLAQAVTRLRGDLERHVGSSALKSTLGTAWKLIAPAALEDLVARTQDAVEGAQRVREIVRNLKTFARMDDEGLSPIQLNDAIESALSIAVNEIKFRARLVQDLGPIPPVMANDGRLSQVFLNLLINAANAIEEGQVEDNEIRVRTWSAGEEVFAEVSDTGHGIAEKDLPRLFEPFFTTKAESAGLGLGLSICHNIVTSYGGSIQVESTVGQGSRFRVSLTRVTEEENRPRRATAGENGQLVSRGRVLLVDDEPNIGIAVQRILSEEHEVVLASSGESGQRILEKDTAFDVILCDLMMPGITGMDLYDWLAKTHPSLVSRVVFITGGAFTPAARAFIKRVPNIQIPKPPDPRNLKILIRELMGKRDRQFD
jgi:two-component system cell cycle sensor histidine kinase/response regulator CckA